MNILVQVDSNGHNLKTFDGIVDFKQGYSNVSKVNTFIRTKRGFRKLRQTTIGCKFLIQWKYGRITWIPLKIMKYPNPVEVAEFVVAIGISD